MLLVLEPWWINTNCTGIFPTLLATQASNGSDNGLVPTIRLAIIWINGGQVYWRIHAPCRLNEVKWVKYSGLPCINSSLPFNELVCRYSSWFASPKANLYLKSGLVQVVEWPRTGVKPLSEPMSTVSRVVTCQCIEFNCRPCISVIDFYVLTSVCTLKVISMDMY